MKCNRSGGRGHALLPRLAAIALAFTVSVPCLAQTDPAPSSTTTTTNVHTRDFSLPAAPLAEAAIAFSEQAGVQLVLGSDGTSGITARAVSGRMTVAQALDRLLDGTGLAWRYLGPDTVTIEPHSAATPSEPNAPRMFAPLRIEGQRDAQRLWADGSTDATATEGTDRLDAPSARAGAKTARAMADAPFSVSAMTATRLQQQGLTDLNEALREMPGISGRMVDGVSGYAFLSRGFEVTTFTYDGGGPTFYQSTFDADVRTLLDAPELAEFDHAELLRGGVGPFGGLSDPSGVINLQRKRPLDHRQLVFDLQLGSWNNRRVEADASMPVAFDGRVRMRVVGVAQDRDFFYDVTHENRAFVYGTVEADVGASMLVRFGGSYRDLRRPGVNATGLPRYLDGGEIDFPRSTCLCLPSNHYDAQQSEQFVAIERRFGPDWQVTLNATRRTQRSEYDTLTLMTLAELDWGIANFPFLSRYGSNLEQWTADLSATGHITLGRTRVAVAVGADYAGSRSRTSGNTTSYDVLNGSPIDAIADLSQPEWRTSPSDQIDLMGQRVDTRQIGPYLTLSMEPIRKVTVEAGARIPFFRIDVAATIGLRFASMTKDAAGPVTPSITVSYRPDARTTLYAGYSRIYRFTPVQTDFSVSSLATVSGDNYEAGLKWRASSNGPLLSLSSYYQSVYRLNESQLEFGPDGDLCCSYRVPKVESYGVDLELTGRIARGWDIQASYNWNRNTYRFKQDLLPWRSQQPEHQGKLWSTYTRADRGGNWQIGGGVRVESARYSNGEFCDDRLNVTATCLIPNTRPFLFPIRFEQPLYAVADLRLARRWTSGFEIAVNLNNVTDTRYYATTAAPAFGNYFGEPREILVSIRAKIG